MSASYEIFEEPLESGETRLTWAKDGKPVDPLAFWFVPADYPLDKARDEVRGGELDAG